MVYDNRPTEPPDDDLPEECPICKRKNFDEETGDFLLPSGHCSEHCARHDEEGSYSPVDFDTADYIGSGENGVYYAVGEGPDGWYLSTTVDSSSFTDTLTKDDGPYKTEEEAKEGGRSAAVEWCVTNQVDWAELPWEDDKLQFARVIWELDAAGISDETLDAMCASMDLDRELLREIFDRAIKVSDDAKGTAEDAVLGV